MSGRRPLLAFSPAGARAVVDMNVVHITMIAANAALEVALQITDDSAVLAFWGMKIDSAAGGVIAASARSSDARIFAKCRDEANIPKPCFDLSEH